MKLSRIRIISLSLSLISVLAVAVFTSTAPSAARSDMSNNTGVITTQDWQNKVDASVLSKAATGQTEFLIYMARQADLSGADALSTKEEKGEYVYRQLTATAAETQPVVKQVLQSFGSEFRGFWVTNAIWGKGGLAAIQAVALRPEVAYVYASGGGSLRLPSQPGGSELTSQSSLTADPAPEPGLLKVNADDVWSLGVLGQGVIVAGADTGVSWQHPALKRQYRGWDEATQTANHSYNWHDSIHAPNTVCGGDTTEPCDDHDHGTHTVGTMVGDDGGTNTIGMAPEAKWIACRNMTEGTGAVPTYMECMQWFIAPTDTAGLNPDPTRAPHVINNSWGCPPSEGCTNPDALHEDVAAVDAWMSQQAGEQSTTETPRLAVG